MFIRLGKEHNEVIVGPVVSKTKEEFKVSISGMCFEYFEEGRGETDFKAICEMLKEFLNVED